MIRVFAVPEGEKIRCDKCTINYKQGAIMFQSSVWGNLCTHCYEPYMLKEVSNEELS